MIYIMADVEADGPIPGDYSMVCFGAIVAAFECFQKPAIPFLAEPPPDSR